jgi:Alanyl-tRNA synthetase
MGEQRDRAKTDARSKKSALADLSVYREFRASGETVFTGYDTLGTHSQILGLLQGGHTVVSATEGQQVEVILAQTPLYAESGGQVSDHGTLCGDNGVARVLDVQKPIPGLISHTVTIESGSLGVGETVLAEVDALTRYEGQRAHSATHLVHAALRDTLGPHATQAGSLNRAGYLRLDFSWNQALPGDAEVAIESIVNSAIRDDLEVTTRILPVDDAKALGAMALFGEKYGDTVRMVDIGGPWSRELCAGTHVGRSSQIGVISILGESSVSSTARRIEALVGTAAVQNFSIEKALVRRLTGMLKTPREDIPTRVEELVEQVKSLEKKVSQAGQVGLQALVPGVLQQFREGRVGSVVSEVSGVTSADDLRSLVGAVAGALPEGAHVIALGTLIEGRGTIVIAASPGAIAAGAHAGDLVKIASGTMGGGAAVSLNSPRVAGPRVALSRQLSKTWTQPWIVCGEAGSSTGNRRGQCPRRSCSERPGGFDGGARRDSSPRGGTQSSGEFG